MTHNPFVEVTKGTTTLYASDRDAFLFLVDALTAMANANNPDQGAVGRLPRDWLPRRKMYLPTMALPDPSANSVRQSTGRPGPAQFALFGAGDFACNLYWQSVSLYLLFFYTDALGLSAALAGSIYMVGALWDGMADLLIGTAAQRYRWRYRRFIALGAVPLGLAFVLLYVAPHLRGASLAGAVVAAQILFRTLYALVNVPYIAWSARFSPDSRDRTILAGVRMLFGTAAALIVVTGTPWLARRLTGDATSVDGFLGAAIVFAMVGMPLLLVLATRAREAVPDGPAADGPLIAVCLRALAENRAFVTLNLAAVAAGAAAALLTQSVLYYFKHVAGDAAEGPQALALMAVAGAVAVPLWMGAATRIGLRAVWLAAAALGLLGFAAFAILPRDGGEAATVVLVVIQAAFTGFNLVFWAMLPNTVDYGEAQTGTRVEALAFGVAGLLQKAGLAAAAGLLGLFYSHIGYTSGVAQSPASVAGIRDLMLYGCSAALALSALIMARNPLRRGVHSAIVAGLAQRGDR